MTAPKRRGTTHLGWCLDGLHGKCPTVTPISGYRCGCPCHDTPVPAQESPSETIGC